MRLNPLACRGPKGAEPITIRAISTPRVGNEVFNGGHYHRSAKHAKLLAGTAQNTVVLESGSSEPEIVHMTQKSFMPETITVWTSQLPTRLLRQR